MAAMAKVKPEHFPETVQRSVFPFNPSAPPTPAESRLSTPALSRHTRRHQTSTRGGTQPYVLTTHGIEYIDVGGPAMPRSHSLPQLSRSDRGHMAGLDVKHSRHKYDDRHEFGHHNVINNVNPFLAHFRIPKWSTTSDAIGIHYRHPEQTYRRVQKNRMPIQYVQM
eukprot:TRINITY_DN4231_c0_g1_i1.p2 TRINITY_DN4231_c0_g1~~TRINITY_DN4231_c0_g1_i1.p2  ORF type:complete len:166 (-),score=27.16 TRINITY_DN4231_c0_g1_i1:106-603(-)